MHEQPPSEATQQIDPEKRRTLAGLKQQSLGLGLNLKLGLESNVANTQETSGLIKQLGDKLSEFDRMKDDYQLEIDRLTDLIFQRTAK